MAAHLENQENMEKSGNKNGQGKVREKDKSGKVCSCIWSITGSINLDTKCAKKGIIY